jgi:hypothetical protein
MPQLPEGAAYALIHHEDINGINSRLQINNIVRFNTSPLSGTSVTNFVVASITEYSTYSLLTLVPAGGGGTNNATTISASIVLEPYTSDITFQNSDYNVLLNNATVGRPNNSNKFIADYVTDQSVPINFQAIRSASAALAATPDSNYTSFRVINPRYNGSENTSDNYNIPNSSGSQPASIDQYDTCIYEFDWMGGGYPEYVNGGTVSLGNILIVNSENSVNVIQPSDPTYPFIVEANLPNGTVIYPTPYAPGGKLGVQLSVVYNRAEAPALSTYYLPKSPNFISTPWTLTYSSSLGSTFVGSLFMGITGSLGVTTTPEGFETTSSIRYLTGDMMANITSSLGITNRWFISFYDNLGPVASGALTQASKSAYIPPIEILSGSINPGPSAYLYLDKTYNFEALNGNYPDRGGFLIWSSPINSYRLIVSGSDSTSFSGIQNGGFTTQFPSPAITENFQTITKTYGSNKT